MFTERTDKIIRQSIAFINISADLADITVFFLLYLWLRLRFDMIKVICVSNLRIRVENLGLSNLSYKESMRAIVVGVHNFGRHKCIGSFRNI